MDAMDEYKSLIDELVERSSSTKADWIKAGQFPNTAENEAINKVLSSLSSEQKNVIADLVNDAKSSGIHDTLAYLSELQNLNNLKISINQSELPVEPFGTELNFDYIARQSGGEWPGL